MKPDISYISKEFAIDKMNYCGNKRKPFLFVINYLTDKSLVLEESEIDNNTIRFQIGKYNNYHNQSTLSKEVYWTPKPISFDEYKNKYSFVKKQIQKGNSFLVNLTQPTPIDTNLNLEDLYNHANAKYKLYIKNEFVVLSPETFIQIKENQVSSFPMKGTIDASIPDAANLIMSNAKEEAEHATIVDLIRNDLSIIASNVTLKRYRYIDELRTMQRNLLQVSSEICGELPQNFHSQIGSIIFKLLPAGSICGAPKKKTLEIIEKAEQYKRGFYTGICGYFDGENLDSAVMIRFIEKQNQHLVYKSGGGITANSDAEKEYNELIQKVYVPIY